MKEVVSLMAILVIALTGCVKPVVVEKPVVQTVIVTPTNTPVPTLTLTPTLTPAPPDTPTPAPTLTPTSTPTSIYVLFPLAFEQRPAEMPLSWHFWERLVVFESPNIIRLKGRPLSLYPELLTVEQKQPFWIRDKDGFRLATEKDDRSGMVLNWRSFVYVDICWPETEDLPDGAEVEVKSVALQGSGSLARDKYTPEKWEVIILFSGQEYKFRFMMYCEEPCRPSLLGSCEIVYRPLDYRDENRVGRIVYHENHDTPFVRFDEPVPESAD